MSTEASGGAYLVELFRRYSAAVLTHKQETEQELAERTRREDRGEVVELPTDEESQNRAELIQRELKALIEKQAQEVMRRGDDREQRRFREIQYVMAAFSDEVFLSMSWEGQDYWREHLLEEQLFATHHAGTQIFANIEALLRQRDPTRGDVAATYLLALSLNFRGRYVGVSGEAEIERYRQQLFAFLFQRNPGLGEEAQLYPQSYAHTLTNKPQSWLPVLRPWLIAIGAVVGLYVVLGHILWSHESSRIARTIDDLREAQRSAKSSESATH